MSTADEPPPPDSLISKDDGIKYWEGVAADVNGMLGGFAHISRIDLQGSRNFLAKLGIGTKVGQQIVGCALEGGAGYVHSLTPPPFSPPLLLVSCPGAANHALPQHWENHGGPAS